LLPTEEEMALFRNFEGDFAELSSVESLFLKLTQQVPDARHRVESMVFALKFPSTSADLFNRIEIMTQACLSVLESEPLARLLKTILVVLLLINSDTMSHELDFGIAIHGLSDRLIRTKTGNGKYTIADIVYGYFKYSFGTDCELPILDKGFSQFCTIASAEREISELNNGIQKRIQLLNGEREKSEAFSIQFAESQISELQEEMAVLKTNYSRVLLYFGEAPDRLFNIFFQDLFSLVSVIHVASSANKVELTDALEEEI
jgi:hypothetical protein